MDGPSTESPNVRRTAWMVWIVLAVVISLVVLLEKKERSVTPNYRAAVQHWFAGEPLYNSKGSGFIYLPQAALVFAPWGLLPKPIGEVLWRWTILGVMALGVYRFTRLASGDDRWFLINTVSSGAIAAGCAHNGQSTLIITGLMLLAVVDICEKKWWRAAALLALSFAFKPVAIVLILLAAAIYPQMLWRLAIGSVIVGISPFLTQTPSYVVSQFVAFSQNSRVAFSDGETGYWAQIFGMLKVAGLDLPSPVQQAGRLIFAGLTLVVCWLSARKLPGARNAFYLYAFSNCYLMLFNSRTEGSTYAMVGPVYGLLLAEAWLQKKNRVRTIGYLAAVIATTLNFDLALLVTTRPNEIWLCPFICVLVTVDLLRCFLRELRASNSLANPSAPAI